VTSYDNSHHGDAMDIDNMDYEQLLQLEGFFVDVLYYLLLF
jgi:hypothetical protein